MTIKPSWRGEDRKWRCGTGLRWPEQTLTQHHVRCRDSVWLTQTQKQPLPAASLIPRTRPKESLAQVPEGDRIILFRFSRPVPRPGSVNSCTSLSLVFRLAVGLAEGSLSHPCWRPRLCGEITLFQREFLGLTASLFQKLVGVFSQGTLNLRPREGRKWPR